MIETRKVFKLFCPWQIEKIENMLEEEAAKGWVLVRNDWSGFVFEKRNPVRMRYCMDYQEKEKPEYFALLEDAGWKLEYKGSDWYLWSKAYEAERPELFTDIDSIIRRSNTILGSLGAVLVVQIPLFVIIMDDTSDRLPVEIGFMVFWGSLIVILAGITIGVVLGIVRLKRRAVNRK